jgi:DNA-binding transcriptional ArsR family regulator
MQALDEKITLDRKSFEALVSESRTSILKSLAERRKTLTELAAQFHLSPSTVKEHMQVLEKAGLVEMKDEGRKWKYYELTRKGISIVQPRELKIWIVLGLTVVAVAAAFFNFISKLPGQAVENSGPVFKAAAGSATEDGAQIMATAAAPERIMNSGMGTVQAGIPAPVAPPMPVDQAAAAVQPAWQTLTPDIVLLILAAVAFGLAAGYLIRKRM